MRRAAAYPSLPTLAMTESTDRKFGTFADFYPYYLSEHANRTCRRLHFAGSTCALVCLATFAATGHPGWLVAAIVSGYAFAWVGHFFFEKNRPATFKYPFYSLAGDWVMYWQTLTGRIRF